jgi:hypothetical protein
LEVVVEVEVVKVVEVVEVEVVKVVEVVEVEVVELLQELKLSNPYHLHSILLQRKLL